MAHGRQKKGAKPALFAADGLEPALLQETREKFLSKILGIVRGVAFPADKGVERIPVNVAKMLQCFVRQLGVIAAGGHDHAPPRQFKAARLQGVWGGGFGGHADALAENAREVISGETAQRITFHQVDFGQTSQLTNIRFLASFPECDWHFSPC
jgi:hypothetical protein